MTGFMVSCLNLPYSVIPNLKYSFVDSVEDTMSKTH